jgi:DNA polymerase-1
MENKDNKKLIVIDGNSLINRAYYAMRPLTNKHGLHTHAIFGFVRMLNRVIQDYCPEYIIVAFDKKAPTFRHAEYNLYKATRKGMPVELAEQVPVLKELLGAMNIAMVELEGFEADDLIGTIVKRGEESDLKPIVITGDRDALQLTSHITDVLLTKKGVSELETYNQQIFEEKYNITPEQFVDLKGLMGDSSDNIPGVPGIGEKTGLKLIQEFGSINELLQRSHEIKNAKQREKIEENAQLALMSRRLAEINTHVPIDIDFEACGFKNPDTEKIVEIYSQLEFYSLLDKLNNSSDIKKSDELADEIERVNKHIITKMEEFNQISGILNQQEKVILHVCSDYNHLDTENITAVTMLAADEYVYFDMSNRELVDAVVSFIQKNELLIIGHDCKASILSLMKLGMKDFSLAFDTAIAQYLIQPERPSYEIESLALEYLNINLTEADSEEEQLNLFSGALKTNFEWDLKRSLVIKKLQLLLEKKLIEDDLEKLYYTIELPLIEILARMEYHGFLVNKNELTMNSAKLSTKIDILTEDIFRLAGEEFNINSPKQLGVILFEKLNLPFGKKTKTGYSTGIDILEKLEKKHEIIPYIIEYRTLAKLKSTYADGLVNFINKNTQKIHAHFNQTVTSTGRISCTEPNLQNIPIKQEEGRLLRKAFIKENKHILVGADYSQIELRILAHLSKDPSLIEAFHQDMDIHRATAARVFNVEPENVTSLQRNNAKAVNFGVIYGMSDYGLSENLHISRKEAGQYITEYFNKYTMVKCFMDESIKNCKEKGYVTTLMNRKRYIPEIYSKNFNIRSMGERLAMNTPIQGSAADLIKKAMVDVFAALKSNRLKAKLILQVHDELILQVPEDEVAIVKELLKEKMESAVQLRVPLKVDLNSADNWYDLK